MSGKLFPNRPSFKGQWIITGIGLLALALALGGNLSIEYKRIEKREINQLVLQTNLIQKILEKNLQSLDIVLKDLQEYAHALGDPQEINHRLGILASALDGVRTLTIYDANGTVVASNRPALIGKNFAQREYFKTVQQSCDPNTLYISSPFQSALGTWIITAGHVIIGPDGKFAGVVNAALDTDFFTPLLDSVLYAPDMWATLGHIGDTIFIRVPQRPGDNNPPTADTMTQFLPYMQNPNNNDIFQKVNFSANENRILAVRLIQPSGLSIDHPLVIGVSRELNAIHENWRRDAMLQGGAFAVVALFSSLVLFFFQKWRRENDLVIAKAAEELAHRDRFIRMVMDHIPAMVSYWNAEKRCEYANKAYREWFGKTEEEIQGIDIRTLLGEALFEENEVYILAVLRGEAQLFEQDRQKADGSTHHTLARYIPDQIGGETRGFFVLVSDVTELKLIQLELERRVHELHVLATMDALTGISNRRHFLERLKSEASRANRYRTPLVFLMIDVDHFKAINDTHGHDVGDAVLKSLGATLKTVLRTVDHVGRLGGEEFGALLIETHLPEARLAAERIREMLRATCIETKTGDICYTVSIGLAVYRDDRDDPLEDMMRRADIALYQAKNSGRDRVCCDGDF